MQNQARDGTKLAEFEAALPDLRPQLHRYAARMTGSVIDGEDVVQETLLKASGALSEGLGVANLRAWLFSIAHNTALNFLRSRKSDFKMKQRAKRMLTASDGAPPAPAVGGNLRPLMILTPRQRSALILREVFGYSASEVAGLTGTSVEAVKSALHRARQRLKSRAENKPDAALPQLSGAERQDLAHYVDCFNAHDFDRLRNLLASRVHLELVSMDERVGKDAVGGYFTNYNRQDDWLLAPGMVESRPCILVFDRNDPTGPPNYFILIRFENGQVHDIRDFRYARYVMADAVWRRL